MDEDKPNTGDQGMAGGQDQNAGGGSMGGGSGSGTEPPQPVDNVEKIPEGGSVEGGQQN